MEETDGIGTELGTLSKVSDESYVYRFQDGREYNITIDVREHEVSAGRVYDDDGNYLEAAGRDTKEALIKVVSRINLQATLKE